jgi:hypothetical protein
MAELEMQPLQSNLDRAKTIIEEYAKTQPNFQKLLDVINGKTKHTEAILTPNEGITMKPDHIEFMSKYLDEIDRSNARNDPEVIALRYAIAESLTAGGKRSKKRSKKRSNRRSKKNRRRRTTSHRRRSRAARSI